MIRKPNVVLINCDDLGWGDLGCYGSSDHRTPEIDRLAKEGVRCTDFYMASSVCTASRGAMLTGCYPPRIDFGKFDEKWVLFPGDPTGLNPTEFTIPQMLRNQGYKTKIVGKWHCGDQAEFLPTRFGFDEYFGLPYSNDMGRQVDERPEFPPLPLLDNESVLEEQPNQTSLTDRYVNESVRFIRKNKDKPFFLYFAHMYVHLPLYVPDRFLKNNSNPYAAAVECIDWSTGVLMNELREQGLSENTIVIFTSDNGSRCDFGNSNGILRGTKFTTWEGGQRVPCIIRWPSNIDAGIKVSKVLSSVDILPTLASILDCSGTIKETIDGMDASSLLKEGTSDQFDNRAFPYYFGNAMEAIRLGSWKLHFCKWREDEGRYKALNELYDLSDDPGETINLFNSSPEIVKELDSAAGLIREVLGDEFTGCVGTEIRLKGRVTDPTPLTNYRPDHPYFIAEYDLPDFG